MNRQVTVIIESKIDIEVPFFQEKYEADGRKGEDYSSDVVEMYGLDLGDMDQADWLAAEADNPHRDCNAELFCTQGAMFSTGWGSLELMVAHKASEAYPAVANQRNDLFDERVKYNADNGISVRTEVYPCDEHWNIDWENPITA